MEFKQVISDLSATSNISFVYNIDFNRFIYLDKIYAGLGQGNGTSISDILSLLHEADIPKLKQSLADLLNGDLEGSVQLRIRTDKEDRWLRLTPFLISTGQERLVAGNIADITAEINNFHSVQKFANKKNSILTMLSHDLRGPLEVARMIAGSLEQNADHASVVKRSKNLAKIIKQALGLVNGLLQREQDETVRVELVKKRVDIAVQMKDYMDEIRLSEEALQREILFSSSSDHIYMQLDEGKFMQIANNLVNNSLKFTRDGDTVALHIEEQEDTILFKFSDTGIGIPEELQGAVFDKFTSARRKGLNGEPSTGIGLSIVKTLLEWHNGTVRVESKEGEGTAFYLEIPKEN